MHTQGDRRQDDGRLTVDDVMMMIWALGRVDGKSHFAPMATDSQWFEMETFVTGRMISIVGRI